MTVRLLLALSLCCVTPALAQAVPVDPPAVPDAPATGVVPTPALPVLTDAEAMRAARELSQRMRVALGSNGVPAAPAEPSLASARAATLARDMLASAGVAIDRPQLVLVVDRAPAVQRLWVMLATPDPRTDWRMLGVVHVSTGKPGRKEHFKTPVGVFTNTPAILGYRAQGTVNEHGIRGIGIKGMRVWDFGWQTTSDWRKDGALTAVRLEMHATDPRYLAGRLGRADSEACIRIPEKFNVFLDRSGLIDAQLLAVAPDDRAVRALLPKDGDPTPIAGDKVVVVDSSEPTATRSDPVLAERINADFAAFLAQKAAAAAATTAAAAPGQAGIVPAAARVARSSSATPSAVSTAGDAVPTPVFPVQPPTPPATTASGR